MHLGHVYPLGDLPLRHLLEEPQLEDSLLPGGKRVQGGGECEPVQRGIEPLVVVPNILRQGNAVVRIGRLQVLVQRPRVSYPAELGGLIDLLLGELARVLKLAHRWPVAQGAGQRLRDLVDSEFVPSDGPGKLYQAAVVSEVVQDRAENARNGQGRKVAAALGIELLYGVQEPYHPDLE